MFMNTSSIFHDAVLQKNSDIAERILLSSDSRLDLIHGFSQQYNIDLLMNLLPTFRSKGLVIKLQEYCEMHSTSH